MDVFITEPQKTIKYTITHFLTDSRLKQFVSLWTTWWNFTIVGVLVLLTFIKNTKNTRIPQNNKVAAHPRFLRYVSSVNTFAPAKSRTSPIVHDVDRLWNRHRFLLTRLCCNFALLLFTIHTNWHITSLLSWSTDHRLQSDHSVWLSLDTEQDTTHLLLLSFLSLSHIHTYSWSVCVNLASSELLYLRQCRYGWGYLGLWSAPLPGTRNSAVSS